MMIVDRYRAQSEVTIHAHVGNVPGGFLVALTA
jgi:hypothetical protein